MGAAAAAAGQQQGTEGARKGANKRQAQVRAMCVAAVPAMCPHFAELICPWSRCHTTHACKEYETGLDAAGALGPPGACSHAFRPLQLLLLLVSVPGICRTEAIATTSCPSPATCQSATAASAARRPLGQWCNSAAGGCIAAARLDLDCHMGSQKQGPPACGSPSTLELFALVVSVYWIVARSSTAWTLRPVLRDLQEPTHNQVADAPELMQPGGPGGVRGTLT